MVKYKIYLEKIKNELGGYRSFVDDCENKFLAGAELLNRRYAEAENAGCYNADYLKQYKADIENEKNELCTGKYAPLMAAKRNATRNIVNKYLGFIENDLNAFFGGDIDPAFASKIQALQSTGVKLSNKEFDVLKSQAKSYFELRVLNQLAEHRTTEKTVTSLHKSDVVTQKQEVPDPYMGKIDLPDPEKAFAEFAHYKASVNATLDFYCGENYKLKNALGNNGKNDNGTEIQAFQYVIAENFFKQNQTADFSAKMDKITAILPRKERSRTLTEKEKAFIDSLIDEKHPYSIPQEVAKYSQLDEHLADLLLCDDRYCDYVVNG